MAPRRYLALDTIATWHMFCCAHSLTAKDVLMLAVSGSGMTSRSEIDLGVVTKFFIFQVSAKQTLTDRELCEVYEVDRATAVDCNICRLCFW